MLFNIGQRVRIEVSEVNLAYGADEVYPNGGTGEVSLPPREKSIGNQIWIKLDRSFKQRLPRTDWREKGRKKEVEELAVPPHFLKEEEV